MVSLADERVNIWHISSAKTDNALFAISSSIAASMSLPFNTRNPCNKNHCGVRSLVALADTREGIIELLREVTLGKTDSAILPLDIVDAAYNGQLKTLTNYPYDSLRLLAPVTSLPVHIVVLQNSDIESIYDARGKVVAFVPGADQTTATHFNRILETYEIDPSEIEYQFLDSQQAKEDLTNGTIDILVMTGQDPIAEIRDLDRETKIKILPLEYEKVQKMLENWPLFIRFVIFLQYLMKTKQVRF